VPSPGVADIDAKIMVNWRALRSNPDLDAGHATAAIDRLLDDRLLLSTGRTAIRPRGSGLIGRAGRPGWASLGLVMTRVLLLRGRGEAR
jgi:hypothetical protein